MAQSDGRTGRNEMCIRDRWKSSDKRIATVSSAGIVKGKKGGTVRITATGKNKKKYTCIVKVKAVQKKTVAVPTATPVQTATPTPIPAPNAYLIGHRGYKTTAPENTFASFRTAVAKGYKACLLYTSLWIFY